MKFLLFFLLLTFSVFAVEEEPKTLKERFDKARSIKEIQAVFYEAVADKKIKSTLKEVSSYLKEVNIKDTRQLPKARVLFDFMTLLDICQYSDVSVEFYTWLTDTKRLKNYIYSLSPQDDSSESIKILYELYQYDQKERDKFYNLMVAFSLVWDEKRKKMHHQMGPKTLKNDGDIKSRYDYFKNLYKRGAKMPYSRLTIQDLVFVVDVPIPLSEMEWARKNVRASVSKWGNLYGSIVYNHPRLNKGQYSWIDGEYRLSEIKEKGGICVDQAYYTIMTARAFGIPSIYFHGVGRNAGERHAWAGYMVSRGKWNMEVGRYSQHNYVTGFSRDPQTNNQMTDHTLDFKCNSDMRKDTFFDCKRYSLMAYFYRNLDLEKSFLLASQALRIEDLHLPAWDIVEQYYKDKKDNVRLVSILKKKMTAFKKYPDFSYEIGQKAIDVLEEIGKTREAESLASLLEKSIKTREDLSETYVKQKVEEMYSSGKADEALKLYEKYLSKQKAMYDQIESDIQLYLKYTKEHEQTKRAPLFMRRFLKGERYKKYKKYLAEAYRNNGEESRASRVK